MNKSANNLYKNRLIIAIAIIAKVFFMSFSLLVNTLFVSHGANVDVFFDIRKAVNLL